MLFNSIDFAIFLPIVFVIYWFLTAKNLKHQNIFLLLCSYLFYGWWDWRFLSLIMASSLIDFYVAQKIEASSNHKKRWLLLSITMNLGLLGFFKYFNFFLDSLTQSFTFFGVPLEANRLDIVLPVGISFYTFQTMSYSIDIFRGTIKPTKDLVTFLGYVSFFPQLVAGPIERASRLLPQFENKRTFNFDSAKAGLYQLIYGLFKKIVIADSCAIYVDEIFAHHQDQSSLVLLLGIFYFSIQIYADFSGYSDIALGTAKLFGFELITNFKMPNFSRDAGEYWRRWHISLSTWFKDYVYIPLGGSRGGKWMIFRNTMLVFLISGLWHGASWNFVIWGGLNGLLFLPLIITNQHRQNMDTVAPNRFLPTIKEAFQVLTTFWLITFTRIFFRSDTLTQATEYASRLFSFNTQGSIALPGIERYAFEIIPLTMVFIGYEWLKRHRQDQMIANKMELAFIFMMLFIFGVYSNVQNFIYFQF